MQDNKNLGYKVASVPTSLMMLGCVFLFGLILASVLMPLLMKVIQKPEAAVRIVTVVQDLLLFILPAFAAAIASTRLPATLLGVDKRPSVTALVGSVVILIVAMPALNCIIDWNQNIHFPASLSALEAKLRATEQAAADATKMLLGGSGVGALIVSILIVGVLAGFSEDLFFRGALQRILMASRMNRHAVIWLVAFIFSVIHFQAFGFVPRLLLGAYFGYLLMWTRSLWVPVTVHIFNNTAVAIFTWKHQGALEGTASDFGSDMSDPVQIAAAIVSALLTAVLLRRFYTFIKKENNLSAAA